MAADWEEIAHLSIPSASDLHGISSALTAVCFDHTQELLWIGTREGTVTSYFGVELRRYVSATAHLNEGPVKQILSLDKGILSISSKSIHLIERNGITIWHLQSPQMLDLRCICHNNISQHVIVAGCQPLILLVDIERGHVVQQVESPHNYILMRRGRHICAATDNGKVHVLNTADLSILKVWDAHGTTVNDMDAQNDFLVTCGISLRSMGQPVVDPLAKVYDLKNLVSLPPIPFHAGAAYIRLHPKLQTTSFVASQTGQMQMMDIMNPVNVMLKQANVVFMLGMEISCSGDASVIVDSSGVLSLWGSPSKRRFNNASKETLFGNPQPPELPSVDWLDSPLNAVGIPFYTERLLSSWPSHMTFEVGAPPPQIDPEFAGRAQSTDMGLVGPYINRKGLHRYQIDDSRITYAPATTMAPKFLSEEAKEIMLHDSPPQPANAVEALTGLRLNGRAQTEEERMQKYDRVEIKYSRFGVDDFNFKWYNSTQYSGLETDISNSFLNSLLQLYKYVPLIRNSAMNHVAACHRVDSCLLCELGYLFDMLEKAAGQNCQATNLLRAFAADKQAVNLNLLESATSHNGGSLSILIQSVNRYFLKRIAGDEAIRIPQNPNAVDDNLATTALEVIRCIFCNNETTKNATTYVHELQYQQIDPKQYRPNMVRFSAVLKASIERESKNRAWCNRCRRYQFLAINKIIRKLPYVLMLNTAMPNQGAEAFWDQPAWLPSEIGLIIQDRGVYCFEGSDLNLHVRNKSRGLMVYELVGHVSEADTNDRDKPHLFSMINTQVSNSKIAHGANGRHTPDWHIFNDFRVEPVEAREALTFDKRWKLPSVVCYQAKTANGIIDESWKSSLQTSLLYQHHSLNGQPPNQMVKLLDPIDENPFFNRYIALDTEFVELEKEEIDIKADGRQETIRPARSGLARVSVVRGDGGEEGTPFVDDFVEITVPIIDYKTQYSGIRPGDLSANTSHNLVILKNAYRKLWLLLNLGCIFVGHGLVSDFRKANIHVPKAQTIDTQQLFQSPGSNRRLSLRYLAWAIFKEYIQEDPPLPLSDVNISQIAGHDSIEDAHMALRLWRRYQEYAKEGTVERVIEEIYKRGHKSGWKPPPRSLAGNVLPEGGTSSNYGSGRNTPEIGGAISGPETPAPRAPSAGFRFSADSTTSAFKESPLR